MAHQKRKMRKLFKVFDIENDVRKIEDTVSLWMASVEVIHNTMEWVRGGKNFIAFVYSPKEARES